MRKLYTLLLCLLALAPRLHAQTTADSTNPNPTAASKPFQDCPGAIALCGKVYRADNAGLSGPGLIPNEAQGSCGTAEQISSWYSFQASSSGLLAFVIISNDVTDTLDFSQVNGSQDYDWLIYRLPAGVSPSLSVCSVLRHDSGTNPYEFACNYSGQTGVTGMFDQRQAVAGGSSQSANGTPFNTPLQVQAGDRFVLLVTNFRSTTVGYTLRFFTPEEDARYADVTQGQPLRILGIDYDPTCTGDCPTVLTLDRPVRCQSMTAQVYNPAHISETYTATVECSATDSTASQTLLLRGSFNPADSTLILVLRTTDTAGYLYQCGTVRTQADTIPLQLGYGGEYRVVTASRKALVSTLQVAPNPFTSELSVTLPGKGRYAFRLLDATGKAVLETSLQGGSSPSVRLPSTLAPGLYSAEAAGEGRVLRQRLTRQ